MYIGEIILNYRNSFKPKMSQRAFASRTSLSPSYINTLEKIFNPKTGKPYSVTTDAALEIATAMNMNIQDLLNMLDKDQEFDINNSKTDKLGNPVVSIPLLGEIRAGYNHLAQQNCIGTEDISPELAKTGEFYALKVKGNSMADSILDGDIAIIKKQDVFEDGKISVVIINGDEGTLKLVKIMDNGIKLVPLNRRINPATNEPYYEDMFFDKKDIETTPVIMAGILVDLKRHYY